MKAIEIFPLCNTKKITFFFLEHAPQHSTNLDEAFFNEPRLALREAGHGCLLQGTVKGGQDLIALGSRVKATRREVNTKDGEA